MKCVLKSIQEGNLLGAVACVCAGRCCCYLDQRLTNQVVDWTALHLDNVGILSDGSKSRCIHV